MFIIATDRIIVFVPHKCGSRTVKEHMYGKPWPSHDSIDKYDPKTKFHMMDMRFSKTLEVMARPFPQTKVVVLRDPKTRLLSAIAKADQLQSNPSNPNYSDWDWMFQVHSEPYMQKLPKHTDFKILPFENFGDYFTKNVGGIEKKQFARPEWDDSYYDEYPWLEKEIEAYQHLLKTRKIITPKEFNSLVSMSNYINIKYYKEDGEIPKEKRKRYKHIESYLGK